MNPNELHLWEMETSWFDKPKSEVMNSTFPYKSWKDFQDCKPYKLWKPYILSSWSWKSIKVDDHGFIKTAKRQDAERHVMDCSKILRLHPSQYDKQLEAIPVPPHTDEIDMLQIVFISPDRFSGILRVEVIVEKDDEVKVREWIKKHMPGFWKL